MQLRHENPHARPHRRAPLAAALSLALTGGALAACGNDDPQSTAPATSAAKGAPTVGGVIDPGDGGVYRPVVDPANFVEAIDNPYFPLTVGSRWVYEGDDDGEVERIEVAVLPERRTVMGISAVVVRDTVTIDGELAEDTHDWYAQDRQGNVWYLGEDTAEYENGQIVSTAGAWEAGVDGAVPGIVMRAAPTEGDAYRQEFYVGEAEDLAEVQAVDATETVNAEPLTGLLVTREWTPLLPDVVEDKYYALGTGLVLEVTVQGGDGRIELVEFTPGA